MTNPSWKGCKVGININITEGGEITISQESAGERALMHDKYTADEELQVAVTNVYNHLNAEKLLDVIRPGDMQISSETDLDEEREASFKRGWDAAVQECKLNYVNDRIEEFFNEMGVVWNPGEGKDEQSEDPHHDEPEGTGEHFDGVVLDDKPASGWSDSKLGREIENNIARMNEARHAANEIGLDVIRPVADSGDPEEEKNKTWDPQNEGTWTISNDELQSRLDAAYNRGWEEKATQQREAGYQEGFANGQTAAKQTTARALEIIAVEEDNRLRNAGAYRPSAPDTIGPSRGDVFGAFAIALAKRLGFEVSA